MKLDRNAVDFDTIKSRVTYDPETGHFYAKVSSGRRSKGDRIGYADKLGYWKISIHGKWIMSHRLAWALMNSNVWPAGEIDHINGNPGDNRIANLRVANRSQNVANAKFSSKNTTGFRGVCIVRRKSIPDGYQATVRKNGRARYLGIFDTPEEAHAAYLKAAREVHGEFFAEDGKQVIETAPTPKQEVLAL